MASSQTLSVRLSAQTRQILADSASAHHAAGASALARDILERWAAQAMERQRSSDIERVAAYVAVHPDGWADDPSDFFPESTR